MANSRSAAKRARQSEKRRQHNVALRSRMRTAVKKVSKAIESGDAEAARSAYRDGMAEVDSMVTRGITHRNTAARHKSRLNRRVKALTTSG